MKNPYLLCFVLLLPFLFYHNNRLDGPDSPIYMAVSHSIVSNGSLNTLPKTLSGEIPWQITKTKHTPIHQNIGGVIFIIPATLSAVLTQSAAQLIPSLPERLYDFSYHEGIWLGCITYLLMLLSCVMIYQVACVYHSSSAVLVALLSCLYGGPLLVYGVVYPCQTNLPTAFLSSLLLYVYHFVDLKKYASWLLLGAVWGIGVFVRIEFAIWGIFLLYAVMKEPTASVGCKTRIFAIGLGGLSYIVALLMIKYILFGELGNTYSFQFDVRFLSNIHLMFFGGRNGLFIFWPILIFSIPGYLVKATRNPQLYHVLFLILFLEAILFGSTVFWSGEFGNSFGQRRFLIVFPCFVFFLARFIEIYRRYVKYIMAICLGCVIWANLAYAAYGLMWHFPDNVVGFLMPDNVEGILRTFIKHYPLFFSELFDLLLEPKHIDVWWLFPIISVFALGVLYAVRNFERQQITRFSTACIMIVGVVITIFLTGAAQRGLSSYQVIAAENKQAKFITRNQEIDYEIIASSIEVIAFFLELHDRPNAQYFKDKTYAFLLKEAPDQIQRFTQLYEALLLRNSMGWERLVLEQDPDILLEWYRLARIELHNNRTPSDIRSQFLY
ncbi:MAG: hypothetical protein PHN84_12715 [Desulfuromonadaceae bacterium]|nr:hypothetical protein [Desulfuromonadaceae bacterium]MDD2855376.1 hypothetical protein [Desulfuromonadaceae bacterium]